MYANFKVTCNHKETAECYSAPVMSLNKADPYQMSEKNDNVGRCKSYTLCTSLLRGWCSSSSYDTYVPFVEVPSETI